MTDSFPGTPHDRFMLAATIYGEARGESFDTQVAVGWTIRNRAQWVSDHGGPLMFGTGTLSSACIAAYQFSCWNTDSPEHETMLDIVSSSGSGDPSFQSCLNAADAVIFGTTPDPTGGCKWYHDSSIPNPPAWGDPALQIGSLTFFRSVDG